MPRKICTVAVLALLVSTTAAAYDYPSSPRGDVVDDYHGTRVADPYRWLEDVDAPATRTWVEAQNRLSLPLLEALPERAPIQQRLTALWNYERYDLPRARAGQLFYTKNDGLQNQSVLYVQGKDGNARVLLDPNTLSADGTTALTDWKISPDGQLLAYTVAVAGSDWNELRVRRIADGQDLPDVLRRIKFSAIAWTRDNAGLFYSRYPGDAGADQPGVFEELRDHKLYYHRLGTPQAQDALIHEEPAHPGWNVVANVTDDGRYLLIYLTQGASNKVALYYKDLGPAAGPKLDARTVKLIDNFDNTYSVIGSRGTTLFVLTDREAPRKKLIAIDLAKPQPKHWRTLIAQGADPISHVEYAGGQFVAVTMHDVATRVLRYSVEGRKLGEIALPGLGSIPEIGDEVQISGEPDSDTLYYAYTSFNQPLTNYRYDLKRGRGAVLNAPKLAFNPADYVTEQVFATSKDGTRVPLFISYKKGLQRSAQTPTYLYGYGGFDISLTPSFSVPNLVWMERGGLYVQANLRGGGEYGSAWHEAGTKQRKQNVFDDFASAAGYLIANGWTSPAHLSIGGRSNGGLLVGATLNQHPELFAAALPGVGVMDMLRFHKFTIGHAWVTDYGSSDDKDGFEYLYKYSPVHNVKPGTHYPAVLVTTADHDDRVVPGHSYKYTAAMQAAQAGDQPVLIRIDVKAGHGAGKPVSKRIEEWADMLAFIAHYTR